jgi:hypothetical protein
MSDVPSVFSVEKILLTALIAMAVSWVFLFLRRRSGTLAVGELVILGLLVSFSVFAWRMVGNVAPLNNDPIPPFSPNDVLCPMITYVLLGIYATFRPPADLGQWEKTRAWLTMVSLVVNVVFI